jgi:hypothetical protein
MTLSRHHLAGLRGILPSSVTRVSLPPAPQRPDDKASVEQRATRDGASLEARKYAHRVQ